MDQSSPKENATVEVTGFRQLFDLLHSTYGEQHWWPAESPFEMIVGAILVQNTAWTGASRAIQALRDKGALTPGAILGMKVHDLEELLTPSGTFRLKAERLINMCRWIRRSGGLDKLADRPTEALRTSLLEIHGIGPETADAILLYAFSRPAFIADFYARRVFWRIGLTRQLHPATEYEKVRRQVLEDAAMEVGDLNEFHALLVEHSKRVCRKTPRCLECDIRTACRARVTDRVQPG